MNIVIALCITALYQAAPHAGRAVDARHRPASHEADHRASHEADHRASHEANRHMTTHDNIAELLIPLLEQSLDGTHDGKHKKVIQVLPYEGSEERENKGWRKLKSNKKQLVEITPLRRRVGNNKHLAYILSSAKSRNDAKDSATSEENTFEDSVEFDTESSQPADVQHGVAASDEKVSSEIEQVLSDEIDIIDTTRVENDVIALDKSLEEDLVSNEPENYDNKELNTMISDEIVTVEESDGSSELEHVVQDISGDLELSASVDSHDLLFGPGNNILFDRGSSESALQDDFGEVNEEVNRSADGDDELAGDGEGSTNVASAEVIAANEVTPEMATIPEYEADAHDTSATYDPAYSSSNTNDLNRYSGVERDFTINRSGNTYEFEGKSVAEPIDSRSKQVIEVLQSVEEKESKYNCDEIERDGAPRHHSREHKSYRLSFLFNK